MKRLNTIFTMLAGVIGAAYLLNIGAGVIELIPDNIPVVGNLDEAAATALVINALLYFRRGKRKTVANENENEPKR